MSQPPSPDQEVNGAGGPPQLPLLLMRTVMVSVTTFPELKNFVATVVLPRLVQRQVRHAFRLHWWTGIVLSIKDLNDRLKQHCDFSLQRCHHEPDFGFCDVFYVVFNIHRAHWVACCLLGYTLVISCRQLSATVVRELSQIVHLSRPAWQTVTVQRMMCCEYNDVKYGLGTCLPFAVMYLVLPLTRVPNRTTS